MRSIYNAHFKANACIKHKCCHCSIILASQKEPLHRADLPFHNMYCSINAEAEHRSDSSLSWQGTRSGLNGFGQNVVMA